MAFTFLHAADLHLDSPLRGLERYEGAPIETVRQATRRATENMVRRAVESRAGFVLIAGDVYDGDWPDFNTGLFFVKQMSVLREAGIPVYLVHGNHDAASVITKALKLPDNVHRFPTAKAGTVTCDDLGVAIHGRSFGKRAVTENLAATYPARVSGMLNIGLLHTSADGREGHDNYAPCSIDDLAAKGYAYWALGHIHQPEIIARDPWIVFPGCVQGRHVGESGPRGIFEVRVDDDGRIAGAELVPIDVMRWEVAELRVDPDGEVRSIDDLHDAALACLRGRLGEADGRSVALRLTITGATDVHADLVRGYEAFTADLRAAVIAEFGERLWLEKVRVRTRPAASIDAILAASGLPDDLLASVEEKLGAFRSGGDPEIEALAKRLEPMGLGDAIGGGGGDAEDLLAREVQGILIAAIRELEGGAGPHGAKGR